MLVVQAPAAPLRGTRRDAARASRASPRSARVRSVYYMVKVLLALFVGVFRRNAVPLEEIR